MLDFKLDIEKAYDSVSWEFLEATMLDFGLPGSISSLIMNYVKSTPSSVLWNGSRLNCFAPTRRLRQGDPLSPYLFILCMHKLSLYITQKVDEGSWPPVKISRNGPLISHLLFADDILLICKARNSQLKLVLDVLNDFCEASGLCINFDKSRALPSMFLVEGMITLLISLLFGLLLICVNIWEFP